MIIAVGTSQPLAALLQIILLAWVQFDGVPCSLFIAASPSSQPTLLPHSSAQHNTIPQEADQLSM